MPEKRAQIILEVAQVIGNQLEISELLGSLNRALTPIIHFDAIGIVNGYPWRLVSNGISERSVSREQALFLVRRWRLREAL